MGNSSSKPAGANPVKQHEHHDEHEEHDEHGQTNNKGEIVADAADNSIAASTTTFAVVTAVGITTGVAVTAFPIALGLGVLGILAGRAIKLRNANKEYKQFAGMVQEYTTAIQDAPHLNAILGNTPTTPLEINAKKFVDALTRQMNKANEILNGYRKFLFFPNSVISSMEKNLLWLGLYISLVLQNSINDLSKKVDALNDKIPAQITETEVTNVVKEAEKASDEIIKEPPAATSVANTTEQKSDTTSVANTTSVADATSVENTPEQKTDAISVADTPSVTDDPGEQDETKLMGVGPDNVAHDGGRRRKRKGSQKRRGKQKQQSLTPASLYLRLKNEIHRQRKLRVKKKTKSKSKSKNNKTLKI